MMFGTIHSIPENSRFSSMKYVLVGAGYGLLGGISFVLMWAFVDIWLYPDLPIGVNWPQVAAQCAFFGLAFALIGAVTCLFSERWLGVAAGAVVTGLLALASALYISSTGTGLKLILILFTLAPVAIMSLPIAWTIRRLADKHAEAMDLSWSWARIMVLVIIAVALSAGAGYFMRMPPRAVLAMRLVHDRLQPASEERGEVANQLPDLQEHALIPYNLFEEPSDESTEGFDIRAEYEDGYTVQCVVVAYPGYNPYIRSCEETDR